MRYTHLHVLKSLFYLAALSLAFGSVSAKAQITFELDRSEVEYPYLGPYVLEAESGETCDLKLTDKMRIFEGFKVETSENCPKPFDKAQAWILNTSGPTIQLLGKWDHIIWNGSDPDGDGRFTGLSNRKDKFSLVSKTSLQPRITAAKNSMQKWEGIWQINLSKNRSQKKGPPICAVALLNEGITAGFKPAIVDPNCIEDVPQVRQLENVMFWDDRPGDGKTISLYDRNRNRLTQFSPFSGNVYIGNIAGRSGKTRTYDWVKTSSLNEISPGETFIPGRYTLKPSDRRDRCTIHLFERRAGMGQEASLPIEACFMNFEIASWAVIEGRLTFFDNFQEQTLSLRQVFPDFWVGRNKQGLTVTLARSVDTVVDR